MKRIQKKLHHCYKSVYNYKKKLINYNVRIVKMSINNNNN